MISIDPDDPRSQDGPECEGTAEERENAVWTFYKAMMTQRYPGFVARARADQDNWGSELVIVFNNGSSATYQRSDSLLNSSHGMREIDAPDCD